MKHLLKIISIFAVLAVVFVSCSKSDGAGGGSHFIKMRVDGRAVICKPLIASVIKYTATVGDQEKELVQVTFSSSSDSNPLENIDLNMSDFKGVGTYDLKKPQNTAQYAKDITNVDEVCGATEGSIVITEFTENSIKGTFQFKGINHNNTKAVHITEGSFYLPLQK